MVRPSGHRVELELNKNGNVLVRRERCLTEDGAWQVALYRARVNIDGNTVAQLSPGSTALLVDSLLTQSVFGRERFERANPGAVPGAADRRAFANLRETVQRPYASWPPSDTSLNQPGDIRRNFEYSNPFQLITAASDPRNPTWVTRYHYAPMATARSALPLPAALTSVEYPPTTTPDGLEQSAQSERFEHSTMGRLLRHIDTGGAVTELSYFDAGDSAPADDDAGRVVSIAGHLKTIRLGAGSVDAVTTFTVNGRGANLSICDARGGIVDYLLDSRDLPLRTTRTLTRPGASAVAYNVSRSYSGEGRLRRETRDVLDENGLPLQSHPEVSFFRYGDSGQVVRRSTGGADPRTWRTTRYVYDSQGRRTREISPEGTIVSTRFDARGNVTRRTFGLGSADASTVSTRYDTGGRKRAEIDARGNVTRFDYDAFGRVRRIVQVVDTDGSLTDRRPLADREGHTRLFSHDANGNVVQERMFEWVEQGRYRLLQRTESHFDERDRPIKLLQDWFPRLPVSVDLSDYETAPPLGATQVETWLFYDPAGRLREQRDGIVRAGPLSSSGSSAAYEYDELGRQTLVSLRLPDLGNAIVCSLRSVCDANGNLAAAVRADHVLDDIGTELRREVFISTAEYDSLNRRVADKDAFGRVRTYHYDSSDRLLSSSDPRGYVTSVEIDHHSEVRARTQQVSLAESIRTEYDYNRDGQVVEIRRLAPPAAPNRTRYDYDLIGRCARVIRGSGSPLAQIETLAYDARGNLTERHRPSGLIERMTYDAFDRPLRRELDPLSITGSNEIGGSLWEENTYDGLGRLVRASTDRTSVELELDSLGNVSRERQQVDGDEKQLLRTFDSMNRRRELLFPSGHRTRFDWDAAGRLLAILELSPSPVGLSGAALPRTVLKRSSVGQAPLEDAYWNGLSTKYIRDAAGHLIELDHCDSAGTRLGLVHLFDGCGNRIQDWQTGPDMNPERPSIAYLYDGQNALTHAYGSSGAQPATLATVLPPSSTLAPAPPADAVGLLIGPPDGPELARYSYDSGGNRAAEWLSAVESVGAVDALDRDVSALYDAQNNEAGSSLRRFDMRGRIVRDQNFSAVYDALGRRVAVRSGARLHRVVFDGASEIALYDVDNGYALLTEWTLTGHVDERIEIAHSGTSFVYHRDYVGSTRMVTGTGGETLARFEYDPYGRPTAVYDSVGIGHRFMGREWDEAVGLYHFRARHYDVAAGRFLQPDPADVNPRRSCYEAFGSNPLVFVDPMGTRHHHSWDPEDDIRQWDLATGRVKPTSIEEEFEAADAKYAFDAPVRELRDRQLTALAYGGALIAGLTTVVVAPEMLAAAPGWVKSTMGALALLPMIQAKDEKDLSKAILPHTSAASPGDLFASIVGWGLVLRTLLAKTKESTLAREPAPGPTSAEAARSADTRAKQLASFMDPRKQGAVVISVVPTVDPVTWAPRADRRQLFLQVSDNYSCRRSPGSRFTRVVVVHVGSCRWWPSSLASGVRRGRGRLGAQLGLVGALAAPGEFEDRRVVDQAVDRSGGGHRVLEDPVPLAKYQVAGDHQGAPLVAFGHEGEEDFDLVRALLDVTDVVEDQEIEGVEALQGAWQGKVTLGGKQLLDEAERGCEEHGVAALHERVAEGRSGVRLSTTREPEAQHVVGALEEVAARELVELRHDTARQARSIEGFQGLSGRKARSAEESLGLSLPALVGFGFEHLQQGGECGGVSRVGESARRLRRECWQLEAREELPHACLHFHREVGHKAPPARRRS